MTTRPTHLIAMVLLTAAAAFAGVTHTVDDDGGADFTSIQAAINAAAPGDVVYVYPGTYAEAVTMKDEVNLYGFAPQSTTIDGEGAAVHVVTYSGTVGAVISGFRITGSQRPTAPGTWHYGGIHVAHGPLTIRNNIIENNHAGISVLDTGNPNIINNTIVNNANGIILQDRGTTAPEPHIPVVAFVYLDDTDAAEDFGKLLVANEIAVDLIPVSAVTRTNMLAYDAILIGNDTGSMGNWADPKAFSAIAESGRPLLGIGTGGSSFFDDLQLATGWIHGWVNNTAQGLFAVNPGHEIFKSPLPIAIPPQGAALTLYEKPTTAIEIYLPQIPPDVDALGRATSDPQHYPLTLEKGKYLLWGFAGAPEIMTQTGKDLFVNAVHVLLRKCYPNLPNPEIIATGSESAGAARRYFLSVTNWASYPAELFEPAPYLPPCGANPNSSRTWVDIYAEDGTNLYGFCGFDEPIDLYDRPWISWPDDEDPPNVYVVLNDRRCDITYVSNVIPLRRDPLVTHTIMNNIITGCQQGIFYYNYTPDGHILYNDVWGNFVRNYHNNNGGTSFVPQPGTGEISANPIFDDADYHLGVGSPCIDAGNPAIEYNDPDETRNDMGVYGGPDATGRGTHAGSGFIFTAIGNIPTSEIEQDPGHPSHGLAVVDAATASDLSIPAYLDAPFGASLRIHGLFGNTDIADGVRFYQILLAPWDAVGNPPEPEDFAPMATGLSKVKYLPQPDGAVLAQVISLGPKTVGGVPGVYELTYEGWWSHIDLRMIWHTYGLPNGKYTLRYKAFRWHPVVPGVLEEYFPTPNDLDHIDLLIDNSPVDVEIHNVKCDPVESPHWNPATDGEIPECGIINLQSNTENLRFNITARHPNGYLRRWVLDALWGKNNYAGIIAQANYPGVVPPNDWPGVTAQEYNSSAGSLTPWEPCSYQFRLRAYTRATNGYGYLTATQYKYSDSFSDHYFIDLGATCAWCGGADINRDGTVNFADLAIMAAHWLQTCGPDCP